MILLKYAMWVSPKRQPYACLSSIPVLRRAEREDILILEMVGNFPTIDPVFLHFPIQLGPHL